jgi:carnitine O-acetyltransferase
VQPPLLLFSHLLTSVRPFFPASVYKAANTRSVETYIDHSGVECDVRTGLPIGSKKTGGQGNGYTDDWDKWQEQGGGAG